MSKINKLKELVDELSLLTPAEIAVFIRKEGVTGTPKDAGGCALANFVRKKTGIDTVAICNVYIIVDVKKKGVSVIRWGSEAPGRFVSNFDAGMYPYLEI